MRSFSAQYLITNASAPLKRPVVTTGDDGRIISIDDTSGRIPETRAVEFYDGIIIPGFVNCHCHLELSHMSGMVLPGAGLGSFITQIRTKRLSAGADEITASAEKADMQMQNEGIVACADICNTPLTFRMKKKSRIRYISLLEVFGIDPLKADKRVEEVKNLAEEAGKIDLEWQIVPHSTYSLSLPLSALVMKLSGSNRITSVHFMETEAERDFLEKGSGELMDSYLSSGMLNSVPETAGSAVAAILEQVTGSGNLILVHNTFADRETVNKIKQRGNTYWCLCPRSNIHISGVLPPAEMLAGEGCEIVIGTDSLASNNSLSILGEIRVLQDNFPSIPFQELVRWSTLNGARALSCQDEFGSIEPGKKPGLLLLENIDIPQMKMLPETRVRRLI